MSLCPPAAIMSAVCPSVFLASTTAPRSASSCTVSLCPSVAAYMSAAPPPQCQLLMPPPRPTVPFLSRTRPSVVVRCVHVRTEIHQQLHIVLVPIQSSPHECCPASVSAACAPLPAPPSPPSHAPVTPSVSALFTSDTKSASSCTISLHPCPAANMSAAQPPQCELLVPPSPPHVPSLSRTRQSVVVRCVHICTELHQESHGVRVPTLCCHLKSRQPVVVPRVYIRAPLHHHAAPLRIAEPSHVLQRPAQDRMARPPRRGVEPAMAARAQDPEHIRLGRRAPVEPRNRRI